MLRLINMFEGDGLLFGVQFSYPGMGLPAFI